MYSVNFGRVYNLSTDCPKLFKYLFCRICCLVSLLGTQFFVVIIVIILFKNEHLYKRKDASWP
ncbi:unnamed protein product [Callosobruchus maculatus]|uniref:Uncharacterized protein n=1 Tax=Callosobruchus maculatus TaxID=64391 RepID=A0A653DDZ3_CALMS|nr:unnamed protein product [Callosobruchus maculatus]